MFGLSRTRRNIVANYAGRGISTVSQIAFVPVYLNLMGMEVYGVIGFATSLLVIVSLLDLGLSTTINRQIAEITSRPDSQAESRQLMRSAELIATCSAIAVVILGMLAASPIATQWLNPETLGADALTDAIRWMFLAMACQLPLMVYEGALFGLQDQVRANILRSVFALLKSGGVCIVLVLVGPTMHVFFVWQFLVSAAQTLTTGWCLWRQMPAGPAPKWTLSGITRFWRFAASISLITVLSMVTTQFDKLLVSKMLSLEVLGSYSLAATVATSLLITVSPIFVALTPRLTQLHATNDEATLVDTYHAACELVSVMVAATGLTIIVFPHWLLWLWMGDPEINQTVSPLLRFLAIGTSMQAILLMPYAAQLAKDWTKLSVVGSVVSLAVALPVLYLATRSYGAIGAACYQATYGLVYVVVITTIMHRRILRGELLVWLTRDTLFPLLCGGAWLFALAALAPAHPSRPLSFVLLAVAATGSAICAIAVTPRVRHRVLGYLRCRSAQ